MGYVKVCLVLTQRSAFQRRCSITGLSNLTKPNDKRYHMTTAQFSSLLDALGEGLYERREILGLTLLTALAGESVFMLGPPGVGKSLIARRLKFAFQDSESFEYLMTRFSTPEEIFGPVSIKKLKEDRYERNTNKYLPSAQIVFLDELWKAGSAIQNALLTVLNERIYRNGDEVMETDIRCIIAASNELPNESELLGALYDRFLIRYELQSIKSASLFTRMLGEKTDTSGDTVPTDLKITRAQWNDWQTKVENVALTESVTNIIHIVREKIEAANKKEDDPQQHIIVSDRRWKKIIGLLKAVAFVHEREQVQLADCFIMTHCLWNQPNQRDKANAIVREAIRDHGYALDMRLPTLRKEIRAFADDIEKESRIPVTESKETPRIVAQEYHLVNSKNDRFAAEKVRVVDVKNLQRNEGKVINYYDGENKLVNRIETILGNEPFTLEVTVNGQRETLQLETHREEYTRYISKRPHKLVQAYWEEWGEKIEQFLSEQEKRFEAQQPNELDQLPNHVLIGKESAALIRHNADNIREELSSLRMQLEKAQHMFRTPEWQHA